MYYFWIKQDGHWMEWGKSESFSNCVDCVRAVVFDNKTTEVEIRGTEGVWHKSSHDRPFTFTEGESTVNVVC